MNEPEARVAVGDYVKWSMTGVQGPRTQTSIVAAISDHPAHRDVILWVLTPGGPDLTSPTLGIRYSHKVLLDKVVALRRPTRTPEDDLELLTW